MKLMIIVHAFETESSKVCCHLPVGVQYKSKFLELLQLDIVFKRESLLHVQKIDDEQPCLSPHSLCCCCSSN